MEKVRDFGLMLSRDETLQAGMAVGDDESVGADRQFWRVVGAGPGSMVKNFGVKAHLGIGVREHVWKLCNWNLCYDVSK